MTQYFSKSAEETRQIGEKLAANLQAGDVVALYGDLGAGKTALVQGIAKGLGIDSRVTSPTFQIVRQYEGKLNHFDVYRIEDEDEMYEIGFDEYLQNGAVSVIEWANLIETLLPASYIRVRIEPLGDTERRIDIWDAQEGWEG